MNTERYEGLAEAYGSDINRWPANEREAALAWREREPEAARVAADVERFLAGDGPEAAQVHGRTSVVGRLSCRRRRGCGGRGGVCKTDALRCGNRFIRAPPSAACRLDRALRSARQTHPRAWA